MIRQREESLIEGSRHLTSPHNPLVKTLLSLRERRERDRTATFLIEGYRELLRAVEMQWPLHTVLVAPSLFLGSNEGALLEQIVAKGTELITCHESVFRKVSYRDRPDGLLAIAPQPARSLDALLKKQPSHPPLFVIAESIEKPGNLGTILRSSDAVGADGVIVCDQCTDLFNPNVVRASVGTLFTVPTVETTGEEALAWLQQQGIPIVAATPHASQEFTEISLIGPIAIAVGTEQLGLSARWMERANLQVRIPMEGVADSLNVAMATTLLLYEAHRQRRQQWGAAPDPAKGHTLWKPG